MAHDLTEAFGERMRGGNMGLLEDLVGAGCLGRKSGKVWRNETVFFH